MASVSKATVTGLVSEAFRKRNKFTQDSMIKVNPQLLALTTTANETQFGGKELDDEVMSSGPQSD